MPDIRKIVTTREVVLAEMGVAPARPIVRAVALAVIANPYAGRSAEDLTELFRAGLALGAVSLRERYRPGPPPPEEPPAATPAELPPV